MLHLFLNYMEEKRIAKANKKTTEGMFSFFIDVVMIIIVILNLLFIIFDWCFDFVFFREYVQTISNDFYIYYNEEIHPNFLLYDSIFVLIFISELFLQWFISITRKSYPKWWLYPFVHWYDVLGCIPSGAFIFLRFFRIFAMSFRLHKMGVINLRRTHFYKQFYSGYQNFTQDIVDRVLIKVIEGVQRGVKNEKEDKNESLIADAIKPDQEQLAKVLAAKIHHAAESNYQLHRDDMKDQIELTIKDAFDNSEKMQKLEHIPIIGNRIISKIENILSDISFQLADSISSKLASDEVAKILENFINTSLDSLLKEATPNKSDRELSKIASDILNRALQEMKEDIESNLNKRTNVFPPEEDAPPTQ